MKKLLSVALTVMILFTASCSKKSVTVSDSNTENPVSESPEDKRAIEEAYNNWYKAWETKNYKLAAQDYSEDAVWVNAFGMKRIGRAEIEKTLKEVFSMDFVMAGKSKTVEKMVKFIKPDVALVTSRVEREGQNTASGKELGTRKTSHSRLFVKSSGKWQIVNHLISDARSTEKPRH